MYCITRSLQHENPSSFQKSSTSLAFTINSLNYQIYSLSTASVANKLQLSTASFINIFHNQQSPLSTASIINCLYQHQPYLSTGPNSSTSPSGEKHIFMLGTSGKNMLWSSFLFFQWWELTMSKVNLWLCWLEGFAAGFPFWRRIKFAARRFPDCRSIPGGCQRLEYRTEVRDAGAARGWNTEQRW